jgi:hypothetical protein
MLTRYGKILVRKPITIENTKATANTFQLNLTIQYLLTYKNIHVDRALRLLPTTLAFLIVPFMHSLLQWIWIASSVYVQV